MTIMAEKLHCEIGNHNWNRAVKRGIKPRNCPKHQPVPKAPKAKPRTLHCQAGDHDWTRPPTKGKPPLHCPEHKPAPVERTTPPVSREEALEKARAAKAAKQEAKRAATKTIKGGFLRLATLQERFSDIDYDTMLVLQYIEKVITGPEREDSISHLLVAQKERIRRLETRARLVAS